MSVVNFSVGHQSLKVCSLMKCNLSLESERVVKPKIQGGSDLHFFDKITFCQESSRGVLPKPVVVHHPSSSSCFSPEYSTRSVPVLLVDVSVA